MKVLNICRDDWANFAYDNAMALRSVGVDCSAYKLNPHVFKYGDEANVSSEANIVNKIKEADVVQIFHSDRSFLHHCKGKRVIVYHTGTVYRQNHKMFNDIFNPVVDRSVIALGEFHNLGAKNEIYMVGAIDETKYEFIRQRGIHLFAHYPSNEKVKGTEKILEMMSGYKLAYSSDKVPVKEQYERMQACDIYIELFSPDQDGKKYGSWGITALEAAAMGKIVVTQNLSSKVYEDNYGECPLFLCETEDDFRKTIYKLANASETYIKYRRILSRQWIEKKHSYRASGNYILKKILC